jgi:hypothetical protein
VFADITTTVVALDHGRSTVFGLIRHFQIIRSVRFRNGDKTSPQGVGRERLAQLLLD